MRLLAAAGRIDRKQEAPLGTDGKGALTLSGLYDRFGRRLYAYACVLAASGTEAEDIVQECFLRLAGRLDELTEVDNLEAYLFAAVRNEALRSRSRWLSWRRRNETAGTVRLARPASDDPAEREEAELIRGAVAGLAAEQREVVFLKIWEDLTFAQIAKVLDISPNTAASRYRYGIEHVRRRLSHE